MLISVKDSGSGIPEEYVEEIFDRFVQIKGQGIEIKGIGLGLSVVKEIIKAHKGEVWCESKLDSGSTFTIALPLYPKEALN
jgi:signal transduction histidine kinase